MGQGRLRVGIVIPVLNEARGLTRLLAQFGDDPSEVVIVDGGSRDRTVVQALEAGFRVLRAERGRARQMNAGAAVYADADVLLFVHADVSLPAGWREAIEEAVGAGAAWGRFDVALDSSRPVLNLVGAMMNLRSRATGIATGDQSVFITRRAWQQVGGWPDVPLMEDIRLSGQLLRAVGRPARLRQRVTVSARRWEQRGVVRTVLLMWTLRALHALGISPRMLHRAYYGSMHAIDPPAVQGRVIVFAKAPREGTVKTRLAATHGTARALDAHRHLLELTVAEAAKVPGVAYELCVAGPDPLDECGVLARRYGFELTAQTGADLGERMANAMTPALARGERVALVGSDSPVLKAWDIAEALAALNGPDAAHVALSPTEDGGYVLIAAAGTVPPIFDCMQWSHAEVLQQTLDRLKAAGVRYRVLRELWDVDDAAGWARWRAL